jgi:ElaB/YqjD/DUF883 family membrane-anchored ribosome-binding protein
LGRLLSEGETLLQSLAGNDGKTEGLGTQARETLHRVCEHLRNARSELIGGARKVDDAVHAHPWPALAASAIAGFLAGLLVRRR